MSSRKKKPHKPPVPRERKGHARQRQHLIDACISALHLYGPSHTTVANVVAIAKMSPGIVRFYFASKAAMLVASLRFLAAEFEERVMLPVARLKHRPVAALEMLVDLYLDADIASPRKVSVWYAFWGEASSRQEYSDICGQKDEGFAALVRELVAALIADSAPSHLDVDVDGVALGLVGALEILWQDIAFQAERDIDRVYAKRRCLAFLAAIFPAQFAASSGTVRRSGLGFAMPCFAASAYHSAPVFAAERAASLHRTWAIAGLDSQLPRAGDFLTAEVAGERVLVVRDERGALHALRNTCLKSPHTLVTLRVGHFERLIECAAHGQRFQLDGHRVGPGSAELRPLDLRVVKGVVFVRPPDVTRTESDPAIDVELARGLVLLSPPVELAVAANWKVLVEQWLESVPAAMPIATGNSLVWTPTAETGWSAQRYRRLVDCVTQPHWRNQFLAPHQLIEARPDGLSILQVFGADPGRCVLRRLDYTAMSPNGAARACLYLAQRLAPLTRNATRELAESVQRGMTEFGYARDGGGPPSPAVAWLRQFLAARVPALAEALSATGLKRNAQALGPI